LLAAVLQPGDGPRPPAVLATLPERLADQHDLLAVELVLTLAERHPRLAGVDPDTGELPRLRLEPDQPGAGGLRAVGLEEELRLQEPAVVGHRLAALALHLERLTSARVERLRHVPVADELLQEFLSHPGLRPRLEAGLRVLLVVLLVLRQSDPADEAGRR